MNQAPGLPTRGSGLVGRGQRSIQTMPSCYRNRQNRVTPGQEEPASPGGGGVALQKRYPFMLGIERWPDIRIQWNITQP